MDHGAVRWPAKHLWMDHSLRETRPQASGGFWAGSLIHNKRDLSGQLYMRNRYYDPSTGRFTQEDPIGIAGGLNVYGFGNGNPAMYSDPYGLSAQDVFVSCRPVDAAPNDYGHCAVRVVNEKLNVDITYELLADGIFQPQRVGKTTPEEVARYSEWVQVTVPDRQTSDEFDINVLKAAEDIAEQRNGEWYWPGGGANSNRYVYDVIKQAGGRVPFAAGVKGR